MVDELFDIGDDGVPVLRVHVQPGAGRTAVSGTHGTALKVRVAAPPEGGRANDACTKLLADVFGVKIADIELASGGSSRSKRFRIANVADDDFPRLLELALEGVTPDRPTPPRGRAL